MTRGRLTFVHLALTLTVSLSAACHGNNARGDARNPSVRNSSRSHTEPVTGSDGTCAAGAPPLRRALVTNMYTADPSAHVFGDTLYVYPSHDLELNPPSNDSGDHYGMKD